MLQAGLNEISRCMGCLGQGMCQNLQRQDGAVLWRGVVDIVRDLHAARAGHVLHDDIGMPGDMLAEMPGEDACRGVVPAAGAKADLQGNLLALVEIRDFVRRRLGHGDESSDCGNDHAIGELIEF